jgi:hypothetical protein
MKTTWFVLVLGATLTAFGAAAPGRSQDRIPELQREAPKDLLPETLTGCVARGSVAGTYLLTNVTKDADSAKTTPREALERTSVTLSGTEVDLNRHVGHRISVTGRYANAALIAPIGTDSQPSAAESGSQVEKRATRAFRITSLTMMSDSCSEQAGSGSSVHAATVSRREA